MKRHDFDPNETLSNLGNETLPYSNNNIVTKPKNNVQTTSSEVVKHDDIKDDMEYASFIPDQDYIALKKDSAVLQEKFTDLSTKFSKLYREYKALLDPRDIKAVAKKNLANAVDIASLLGFIDTDSILAKEAGNPSLKEIMQFLSKSEDKSMLLVRNNLMYIATLEKEASPKSIASLLDMSLTFGCTPLRNELYLINTGSGCWVCMHYLFKAGYCFGKGLVTERIELPIIEKDPKGNADEDICKITLHLPNSKKFQFERQRKEIKNFLGAVMLKSPDFGFKKTVMSQAITMCFASEFTGVYIPEELGLNEEKIGINVTNSIIDTSSVATES